MHLETGCAHSHNLRNTPVQCPVKCPKSIRVALMVFHLHYCPISVARFVISRPSRPSSMFCYFKTISALRGVDRSASLFLSQWAKSNPHPSPFCPGKIFRKSIGRAATDHADTHWHSPQAGLEPIKESITRWPV